MRAGRHYAQFTVVRGRDFFLGMIRPGCDVDNERRGQRARSLLYDTHTGDRYPGARD
jgi:hypothetical protein